MGSMGSSGPLRLRGLTAEPVVVVGAVFRVVGLPAVLDGVFVFLLMETTVRRSGHSQGFLCFLRIPSMSRPCPVRMRDVAYATGRSSRCLRA